MHGFYVKHSQIVPLRSCFGSSFFLSGRVELDFPQSQTFLVNMSINFVARLCNFLTGTQCKSNIAKTFPDQAVEPLSFLKRLLCVKKKNEGKNGQNPIVKM